MKDNSKMGMDQQATLISNKGIVEGTGLIDYFDIECRDSDGNFKWRETIKNLVTNEGLDYIMDTGFLGSPNTPIDAWYMGLKGTGAPAANDAAAQLPSGTMAWTEYEDYSSATRPAITLSENGVGQVDNSGNVTSFTIASPAADVYGVFVVDANGKGTNTSATVLYGVGDFTGGAKAVDPDDTLNVTVTLTATSA